MGEMKELDMTENDDGTEVSVFVKPNGVENGVFILALLMMAAMATVAGYSVGDYHARNTNENCMLSAETAKSEADAHQAQMNLNITLQKRLSDIQTKVIDACVAQKHVPIMDAGGGVDCR